jgi:8-oxo-dGTP pyrophosphatase MutT (NUDIX family)
MLIHNSSNNGLLYEIPKGRKTNKEETNLDCAIREFYEETGISYKNYTIDMTIKPIKQCFTSNNVTYHNIYYVANTTSQEPIKLKFNTKIQISEIDEILWLCKNEINVIDKRKLLNNLIKTF